MAAAVVNAASPSTGFFCSHTHRRKSLLHSSPSVFFGSENPRSFLCRSIPLPSHWNGLKNLGISPRRNCRRKEKKGKCRGRVVYASLFGVGAPEALVIGVVALLVFGPKGLAEVARNLGKTLRAFQPTIRELQEVSREFKSTLEREIGLDEVASSTNDIYKSTSPLNQNQQSTIDPNGKPTTKAYSSEELLRITEEQLAASAIRPQTKSSNSDAQTKATPEAAASSSVPPEVATTQIPSSSAPPEVTTDQIPSSSSEKADIDR